MTGVTAPVPAPSAPADSPTRNALRLLLRHRLAMFGAVLVAIEVGLAVLAPWTQGCLLIKTRPVGKGIGVTSDDLPWVSRLEGEKVYNLIQPDRIPAIDEPVLVPATAADFMADDELVLGVVAGGIAKAYSLWHLDRHEIVNDWLGDEPIAATW